MFALVALLTLGKARSGAVVAIADMLEMNLETLMVLVGCAFVAGSLALAFGWKLAERLPEVIRKIDYRKMTMATIVFLLAIVVYLARAWGLAILLVGTALGLLTNSLRIKKMHLMGCLVVPAALWYLGVAQVIA